VPSVLIVDSESAQRRSLSLALRLEGFRVAVASKSTDVMRTLRETPGYDIVMIDLMIPELSGLDLAREIRSAFPLSPTNGWEGDAPASPRTTSPQIVLTSAYPLSQRQLERTECGAVGFIPKPYEIDEVARYLRELSTRKPGLRRPTPMPGSTPALPHVLAAVSEDDSRQEVG